MCPFFHYSSRFMILNKLIPEMPTSAVFLFPLPLQFLCTLNSFGNRCFVVVDIKACCHPCNGRSAVNYLRGIFKPFYFGVSWPWLFAYLHHRNIFIYIHVLFSQVYSCYNTYIYSLHVQDCSYWNVYCWLLRIMIVFNVTSSKMAYFQWQ